MVNNVNGVFYATTYHPIQAGSIDGTDITAHDNGVFRALLGSATGLYDRLGDPKAEGDPYCSLFVGRLSAQTDENSLRQAMSKFGRVKNLRLVRHIVTGASCGYAFVEFATEKDMRVAYEQAHLSKLDGASILVDYNRQQLMSGWIPRRLGGGLGGKKESGQLRFGGRDRPFRAPLRPIPHEELRKLGIPLPPEGRYMTRFQVPPPPQRKQYTTSENDGRSKAVNDKDSHGSDAEEARERDRHRRRRRDEFSDQDYHDTESRSHRKHRSDQESSKYEVEPKRADSGDEEERHGRRKRRTEQSLEYDEDDRKRHRRESRNHTEYNEPDPEQSHGRRRYRSESDDRQLSRESEKKHHRHKHRHRDREDGSPSREDYEGRHHRSSRKHHKSTGEEREKKKSKHRERDNV